MLPVARETAAASAMCLAEFMRSRGARGGVRGGVIASRGPVVPALWLFGFAVIVGEAACRGERREDAAPTWEGGVASIVASQCMRCHAGFAPAGGWRAEDFLGAVGCTATGAPATASRDGEPAPILTALGRPDHAGVAAAFQREALAAWISGGSPRSVAGVHGASFADPRLPRAMGASRASVGALFDTTTRTRERAMTVSARGDPGDDGRRRRAAVHELPCRVGWASRVQHVPRSRRARRERTSRLPAARSVLLPRGRARSRARGARRDEPVAVERASMCDVSPRAVARCHERCPRQRVRRRVVRLRDRRA